MHFAVKPVYTGVAGEAKNYGINQPSDEYAGTPLGYCIHVSVLEEFMAEHGVKFREEYADTGRRIYCELPFLFRNAFPEIFGQKSRTVISSSGNRKINSVS